MPSGESDYLRRFREREFQLIFGRCPPRVFARALELGAGHGLQAPLLARIAQQVVSTDFHPRILDSRPVSRVTFRVADAERVDADFPPGSFDLVFSSNLLEHVPDPDRALAACRAVLADDGLVVHVLPSPLWKATHLALHLPDRLITAARLLRSGGLGEKLSASATPDERAFASNNPKTERPRRSLAARLFVPEPHGVSRGNLEEFAAFAAPRWRRAMRRAGLEVVAEIAGPAASGYALGFDRLRRALERVGWSSETAFVAVKAGRRPPALRWFPDHR